MTVDPTYTDNFWGVKGTITVYNYHPTEAMTLTSLTDLAGGIDGNVTCESLVVPAAGSLTCTYDTGAQDTPERQPVRRPQHRHGGLRRSELDGHVRRSSSAPHRPPRMSR